MGELMKNKKAMNVTFVCICFGLTEEILKLYAIDIGWMIYVIDIMYCIGLYIILFKGTLFSQLLAGIIFCLSLLKGLVIPTETFLMIDAAISGLILIYFFIRFFPAQN